MLISQIFQDLKNLTKTQRSSEKPSWEAWCRWGCRQLKNEGVGQWRRQ